MFNLLKGFLMTYTQLLEDLEFDKTYTIHYLTNNVLPFVPRGLNDYVDHGIRHIRETIYKKNRLLEWLGINGVSLEPLEHIVLELSIWLHDVGCIVKRDDHGKRSAKIVKKLDFGIDLKLRECIETIIFHHTDVTLRDIKKLDIFEFRPLLTVRQDILVAILRLSDALDAGNRKTRSENFGMRAPSSIYEILTSFCRPNQETKNHWKAHMACLGVDLNPSTNIIEINRIDDREGRHLVSKIIRTGIAKELGKFMNVMERHSSTLPMITIKTIVLK